MSVPSKLVQQEAIEDLRKMIKPGDTVYTVLRHVSRSGMSRNVDVYLIDDNKPHWISPLVARAIKFPFDDKRESIKVSGCGMDVGFEVGFEVVYELSYRLFPESFVCIGEGCAANDHFNGDRNYEPHQHSKGAAGYALHHKWM